ncbi:hypothetical protein MAL1_00249 [Bacteriophage DSS3_MAL1]|nr:hypothetical protein MAL1_00249 [Bacteriophage DSS3_MAL1]
MAYITTEQVADIRARLKEAFPVKDGWKLSVRRRDAMAVDVLFMAGPHTFKAWDYDPYSHDPDAPKSSQHAQAMGAIAEVTEGGVNQYYIADNWTPESAKILQKAYDIIARDHWDESDSQSDYFHCAYYISMGIGRWDKPYQVVKQKEKVAA